MFTLSGDPDTTGRLARDVIVRNVTFNIKKKRSGMWMRGCVQLTRLGYIELHYFYTDSWLYREVEIFFKNYSHIPVDCGSEDVFS